MSIEYYEKPLALLIGLDGYELFFPLSQDPPPRELRLPRIVPMTIREPEPPQYRKDNHRVFLRSESVVCKEHSYFRLNEGGRSRSPVRVPVYFEQQAVEGDRS